MKDDTARRWLLRAYTPADEEGVIALWDKCDLIRPWNDPRRDIARKLCVDAGWFIVAADHSSIVGTVMAGYDGHRGWVNYLAVDPDHRRSGIGRRLMNHAESLLRDAGCPKINLQIRESHAVAAAFYEALGYRIDPVVSMGKRLVDDRDI